jgi:hypothetical protein
MVNRLAVLILVQCTLCLSSGCGYSHTGSEPKDGYQWRSLYREDVRTVAVPIFATRSFHRGVEISLSNALARQIEAQSPYKVAPRERADTIIEGEVVDVAIDTISNDINNAIPQEQLYVVTVNFTWKDLRTGRVLVDRRNFRQTTTYYPTLGEGRFVGSQQAVERLALGIVQEMQADW